MTCATRKEQLVVPRRHARTLVENGFDVYFCVSDDDPIETIDGIKYVPVGYNGGNYLKRLFALSRLMSKVAFQIDADYYQTESPDFLRLMLKLKRKGKKCLFTLFEEHPFTYYKKTIFPRIITQMGVSVMAAYMKRAFMQMDVVFAVSDDIMDYLNSWGLKNTELLGNYPEVNKSFSLSKEDYMKRDNRIIYYGHIPESSRQTNVIKAVGEIPNIKYLIAGKFWDKNYLNSLKNLDGWNNVEFIDGFERQQLPEILSMCTISNTARDFINSKCPNGSLGILKIFESMEAALPIICVDVPVYRQLIEDYHCGILVDINNVESIKNAIEYLVVHKEEAYEMGQNGRRAVIEKYNWEQVSKVYMSYIK